MNTNFLKGRNGKGELFQTKGGIALKTCVIFGAAEGLPETFRKQENNFIIAADAGLLHLRRLGVEPDLAVGDFDSLGIAPDCKEVIRHPVRKNDTDSLLAVKIGFERGYRRFLLYGCSGARPDHTFANYQVLHFLAARGGIGLLCQGAFTACVLPKGSATFTPAVPGNISLFAVGEQATVSAKGLSYALDQTALTCDFPLGQSNRFTEKCATVTVHQGFLLSIWQGKPSDFSHFEPDFCEK